MNDAVGFAVRLVNEKDLERVTEGATLGAQAFEQTGRITDDFRRVTKEKKPFVVQFAKGELGFPVERTGLIIRDVEIVAGTAIPLFSLTTSVKNDADVVVDDYIFTVANDFRPLKERAN